MYKAIFFDLDGTLTESGEGITKSVQYALEKLGVSASDLEPLKVFVGPPLLDQFMKYAGFDKETAENGIQKKECMRTPFIRVWKMPWRS